MGVQTRRSTGRFISLLAIAAMAAGVTAVASSVAGSAVTSSTADITFQPGDNPQGREPLTVGADSVVARFIDPDNVGSIEAPSTSLSIPLCGNASLYTAVIDWGDGATGTGTVECSSAATSQYEVIVDTDHKYTDSGTYQISVTVNDSANDQPAAAAAASSSVSDADTANTATATVSDAGIPDGRAGNLTGTEGGSSSLTAFFLDQGSTFTVQDPGLSATVDWGDGTTTSGTIGPGGGECDCTVTVSASHKYDAKPGGGAYSGAVTLNDDGGSTKTATFTATIADAKLTADASKSFTATGGQAGSFTVASFTDAAGSQAAVADFSASINWGDGSTSTGTLTQTASGAFSVSGSHTYSTAGTKSLTVTVTDEEGQTVTMTATATVPALPATGQPQQPSTPAWPLYLALLILGSAFAGAGVIGAKIRRA